MGHSSPDRYEVRWDVTHRGDDDETAGATGTADDGDDQARRNGDAAGHQISQPLLHPDVQKPLYVRNRRRRKATGLIRIKIAFAALIACTW